VPFCANVLKFTHSHSYILNNQYDNSNYSYGYRNPPKRNFIFRVKKKKIRQYQYNQVKNSQNVKYDPCFQDGDSIGWQSCLAYGRINEL